MPNGEHKDEGKEFDGKTFLYIRTHPNDSGAEPLPAGLEAWLSPDIVIVKPDGSRGTEAVADQINQVEVTVTNAGGIDAVDAYVDAFCSDPGTAFTPLALPPVGGGFVTIPGYSRRAISFNWMPAGSEAGHRCVVARVQLVIPPDGYRDGTIFDVWGDRHVAQRNINILSLDTHQALQFRFFIANPARKAGRFRIEIGQVVDPQKLRQLGQSVGCETVQFSTRPLTSFGLALIKEGNRAKSKVKMKEAIAEEVKPVALKYLQSAEKLSSKRSLSLTLEPGDSRSAVAVVGRNARTQLGELQVLEVRQIGQRKQLIGGLTLIIRH